MLRICLAAAALAVALPALAQTTVRPTTDDMTPAANTATSAPDGGKQYTYPPDTGSLRPTNTPRVDGTMSGPAGSTMPNEGLGAGLNTPGAARSGQENKPASQVGR